MSSRKVFVHNLPYGFEKADVQDVFGKYGDIVEVEVMRGRDGQSRGMVIIEFDSSSDAEYFTLLMCWSQQIHIGRQVVDCSFVMELLYMKLSICKFRQALHSQDEPPTP